MYYVHVTFRSLPMTLKYHEIDICVQKSNKNYTTSVKNTIKKIRLVGIKH